MAEAVIAFKIICTKNRRIFLLILKILIAMGILIFIYYKVDMQKIFYAFTEADKLMILFAFVLSIFNIYIQYLKWELVCNSLLKEYSKKRILLSLFYGFSAGLFTPARIGEYFGRAIQLPGKPVLQVTAASAIDKFFTLMVVAVIGAVSFLFFVNLSSGVAGLLILSGLLIFYFLKTRSALFKGNSFLTWLLKFKKISSSYTCLSFIKNIERKFRLRLTILSLLFYVCFLIQYALLVMAFTNHFSIINYIWAGILVMFAKTIIPAISFGDLGIREGASVYFIKQVGEAAAAGFNASIFLFLINILFPALTGLILLIKRK
jgi:uncharacterized protein (TIRG00374 family)